MFSGLDHVTKAVQALVSDKPYLDRLHTAATEVRVALVQPEEWPDELLEPARSIRERGRRLDQLSGPELAQFTDDVLDLWEKVGRARRIHDLQEDDID